MALKSLLQRAFIGVMHRPKARRASRAVVGALPVPDAVLKRLPIEGQFYFEAAGSEFMYTARPNDPVGRALFWRRSGKYESETIHVLRDHLRNARVFLDIGANTGVFSLTAVAVNPRISVHAFEPAPEAFEALEVNIVANVLTDRVICNRLAVGAVVGLVPLHVPALTLANARIGTEGFRGLPGRVENVPCTTLDAYVAGTGLETVDVVKVDVEGREHLVLEGARLTLRRHRPVIVCECLPETDTAAIQAVLDSCEYTPYHLTGAGPRAIEQLTPDKTDRFRNFLFLPTGDD